MRVKKFGFVDCATKTAKSKRPLISQQPEFAGNPHIFFERLIKAEKNLLRNLFCRKMNF